VLTSVWVRRQGDKERKRGREEERKRGREEERKRGREEERKRGGKGRRERGGAKGAARKERKIKVNDSTHEYDKVAGCETSLKH